MNQYKLALIAATVVGIFVASAFGLAFLRPSPAAPPVTSWRYTANWACNVPLPGQTFVPDSAQSLGLVPGEYQVKINVQNPSSTANATLKGEFVESVQQAPQDIIPKWITKSKNWTLKPQAGLYVDCYSLNQLFQWAPNDPFSRPTGFATLTANTPNLDMIVTYTARTFNVTSSGLVPTGISIHVQQITPVPAS